MWLAGAPRDCIVPFYEATVPHSYIGWGKTTHLGFGIPLMIGAKMACPDKMCVNLMGDGAFGMSGTDVETSARSVSATPFRRDDGSARTIWLVSGILCVAHLLCVDRASRSRPCSSTTPQWYARPQPHPTSRIAQSSILSPRVSGLWLMDRSGV